MVFFGRILTTAGGLGSENQKYARIKLHTEVIDACAPYILSREAIGGMFEKLDFVSRKLDLMNVGTIQLIGLASGHSGSPFIARLLDVPLGILLIRVTPLSFVWMTNR